jgi:hypothetical protein
MAVESYQDVGRRWSGDLGCGRRNPLFPVRTRFTSPTAPEFCSSFISMEFPHPGYRPTRPIRLHPMPQQHTLGTSLRRPGDRRSCPETLPSCSTGGLRPPPPCGQCQNHAVDHCWAGSGDLSPHAAALAFSRPIEVTPFSRKPWHLIVSRPGRPFVTRCRLLTNEPAGQD